jgi:hypothetical protein
MTALQKKLDIIAVDVGKLGMGCAILLFHFLVLRDIILQGLFRGVDQGTFDLVGGELSPDNLKTRAGKECRIVPAG